MHIYQSICSCGSCGYELNLSSCNRSISSIGSKYGKSIKRGIISFSNIDNSRFMELDEIECSPHFLKHSWGLFRRRTKLLCRKCCNHIGYAYNGYNTSSYTMYDIRIRALQPSSTGESGISVFA
ncbi:unnamed protein product [Lupinus luteus]|uniref:Uncharacterized protein n=1 Tax=Lupinus luteus TaxID=3873 RepID=A0AAV1W8J5_LUPLU